jgi:hypothetical protein
MRKRALLISVALLAAACSASERAIAPTARTAAKTPTPPAGPERSSVLGLLWGGESAVLARLQARTLRPLGRRIEVGGGGDQALSPEGGVLAVASAVTSGPSADSGRSELELVNVRSLRRIGRLELGMSGLVSKIVWDEPNRIVVLLDDPPRIVTVETRPLRATSSAAVRGRVVASDAEAGRLVLLLAPTGSIGPSQLALVESDGGVRTVALPEILAGWEAVDVAGDPHGLRQQLPGLAVSPDGTRAVVVPAGDRVAEIELDPLRVSYHELSERTSPFRRLYTWLEGEAKAKTVEGPDRFALWLGGDKVAVTGTNYLSLRDGEFEASPAGLSLLDTRDWSVRTLADQAAGMVAVRDLVLAFGWAHSENDAGIGLRAYGADGEERFHLFGNAPLDWVDAAWPYAYVPRGGGKRFDVVDLRSGHVVARARPKVSVSIVAG